jgi:hypothetical protein
MQPTVFTNAIIELGVPPAALAAVRVGAAAARALVQAVGTAMTPTSATLTRATAPVPKACVGQ